MSTAAKRIPIVLSILLAAMLAAALAPQPALADEGHPFGGCTWTLDEDGVLKIWPTDNVSGVLPSNDNKDWGFWPWDTVRWEVKSVSISKGVKAGESVCWMFSGYQGLVSADLSNLDVSDTRSLESMFDGLESLESLDLSGWDTSRVETVSNMFCSCKSLESLDLSGWDTSSVLDDIDMFKDCESLAELKLGAKTRLAKLPPSEVNGRRDWYSPDAKRWFPDADELNDYLEPLDAGAVCTLTKGTSIEGAEWSGIEDKTYTGVAQTQNPTLTLGGKTLEPRHYELSYADNVDAGTATVTATGVDSGGYVGTASRTFTITRAEVAVPKAKSGLVYNGKSQTGVAAGKEYAVEGGSATAAGEHTATLTADANHVFPGGNATASVNWSIAKAEVSVPKAKSGLVYNGKSQTGVPAGAGYTVKGGSAKAAGSYTATLTADANHVFPAGKTTAAVAWKIAKAKGAVAAKARSSKPVTVAAGKSVPATKALKVTKNASKGKVTYKKVKGDKRIVVKNGKITVRKGLKKGTYAIKVKATSAATANYKAATSKAITLKIKVK